MFSKIIFSILIGVLVIGITQFSFAEESKNASRISVDVDAFEQPTSKYDSQEIRISGHVVDYSRGQNIIIVIISPNESEEIINTFASKKGNIHTLLHVTEDSVVGMHQVILKYQEEEIASTSFEILENQ